MKDPEKSRARSRESDITDPEKESCWQYRTKKSHNDSAARSHESYLKDPEKSRARNHESYMKDPEKSHADSAAQSRESYEKDLEKSRWNETGLAISYKSKKTAAVYLIGLASDQT